MAVACAVPNDANTALQCRVKILQVLTACFSPRESVSCMHVADSAVGLVQGMMPGGMMPHMGMPMGMPPFWRPPMGGPFPPPYGYR